MAVAEVYSPTAAAAAQHQQRGKAATQAWQAVVGWIGFLLQVLLQILRGTPSYAQLLSFVGFLYPLLSAMAGPDQPLPEVAFMSLRSEIPADASPIPAPPPEPLERLMPDTWDGDDDGIWKPRRIPNPAYKGQWKRKGWNKK